jgi:hypothetical protein
VTVGDILPDRPIFLTADYDVICPLEATYEATWSVFPVVLKAPFEQPGPASGTTSPAARPKLPKGQRLEECARNALKFGRRKNMRLPRVRFTTRAIMIAVAVVAVLLMCFYDRSTHRERCYDIASRHASLSTEYRRNARGSDDMLKIATWHDHMRRMFENAANRVWEPVPQSSPFPPTTWQPPAITEPTD